MSDVERYVEAIIDGASAIRLPDIFAGEHPGTLYRLTDRSGVSVVALPTTALSAAELTALLRYRMAQYLAVGFLDPAKVYEQRIEHEPLSTAAPGDVHVVAGRAETAEILCYATLRSLPEVAPGTTLRTRERPMLEVERIHGWGIFNCLRVLPDLPVARIREAGRFVKNQRLDRFDEEGLRSPVEVCAAITHLLAEPLRWEVEAIIGEFEENVAKNNLTYFHVPLVTIHGTVPYVDESSMHLPRFQLRPAYPFAFLCSDLVIALPRLRVIEEALALPGKEGLMALLALKADVPALTSSLEPAGGLEPLTQADVPQTTLSMSTRHAMLATGEVLRRSGLFADLSVAEATVLGSFMERRAVEAGEMVIRQGEIGDDLFLIEEGTAEVQINVHGGGPLVMATLGAGEYFGEISLLTGAERSADILALTPLRLLCLTRQAYTRYLGHAAAVERRMSRAAAARGRANLGRLQSKE